MIRLWSRHARAGVDAVVRQRPTKALQQPRKFGNFDCMVTLNEIRRYAKDVARSFHPDRVVLFGSYADGTATPDSDVDLLVVMDHPGRDVEQAFAIRRSVKRRFSLDLVVRTPLEMRRRLAERDSFLTTISRTGKTLYEKRTGRVDQQG